MTASSKLLVAVDPVLVAVGPTLVEVAFEPQAARVITSASGATQLAVHRGLRTTGTLRDVPGAGRHFAKRAHGQTLS